MVRWQPPPADAQNGEITGYKIRYRKGTRKSEAAEITSGSQLYQLIDGKLNNTSNNTFCNFFHVSFSVITLYYKYTDRLIDR